MVNIPRRRPDRITQKLSAATTAWVVVLLALLFIVVAYLIPDRADAAQSDFSITRVNGIVNLYLIKHKPTGTCFVAQYNGGITQTKPEVCQ